MAENTTKIKLNTLAAELGMSAKDVISIAEECGIKNLKSGATVSTEMFDVIFNKLLTDNQISDINSYLSGKTYILMKGEKIDSLMQETESKPEDKTPKTDSVKADGKAEEKTDAGRDNAHEKSARSDVTSQTSENRNASSDQDRRARKLDRFASNAVSQKTNEKSASKSQKSQKKTNTIDIFSDKVNDENDTVIRTISDEDAGGTKDSKVRIVDTRSTNVDLSKYNDGFERFVEGDKKAAFDEENTRQKFKKNSKPGDNQSAAQGKGNSQKNQKTGKSDNRNSFDKEKSERNDKFDRNSKKGGKNNFKGNNKGKQEPIKKAALEIELPNEIMVSELASMLKTPVKEVIKKLMMLGAMATVNQFIDFDTASLVAIEFGATVTKEQKKSIEEMLFTEKEDSEDELETRAPVVCVMGHVDHGKTSLLDAIRHTKVTAGEAGGITQHIGAYRVSINGRDITFLDTPGHEAFTAMRARGAKSTDIAILVVAGDDGIMPQTIEAINHAKAAGIEIIVAINKMDKPHANADNVMQELTKYDLLPEAWGGDTICVPVSALTKMGIDDLLENVLLVADMKELKANPNKKAKGLVIESKLDRGRGPVATVLIQNGTLHSGDVVIAGTAVGRVRVMNDENGRSVKLAGPSVPVEIVGLSEVPQAGDEFNAVDDERMARDLAEQRKMNAKEANFRVNAPMSIENLFDRINAGVKELNIIVKADVMGSVEAVKASLLKLTNEEVKISVIHSAVGGITDNDVTLASASGAIIVGFNVRPDKNAIDFAERQKVEIRTYRVIYDCIDEISAAMKGMLAPKFRENVIGHAEVRQTIRVPSVGVIAGSYILDGKIARKAEIRVLRDSIVIFEDKIASLRRFKDDVKEVNEGYECGIGLEKFNDIKEGDILEAFIMIEENV